MATEWQPQNPGSIIWIAAIPVLFPFYSKNFESFAKPNQCKLVALDILFMTTLSLLDWELLILEIKLDVVWVLNEWCLQGSHIVLWWSSGQITFESYLFSVNNMSECWQRFLLAMLGIHREHDETKSLHFCFKKNRLEWTGLQRFLRREPHSLKYHLLTHQLNFYVSKHRLPLAEITGCCCRGF